MKPVQNIVAVAALALLGMSQAHAALQSHVESWEVKTSGTWTAYTSSNNYNPNNPASDPWIAQSNDGTTLSWHTGIPVNERSSLSITNPSNFIIDTVVGNGIPTGSQIGETIKLTHDNQTISLEATLRRATLSVGLEVRPEGDQGEFTDLTTFDYDIFFYETTNTAGTCLITSSPIPCNDIFVMNAGSLNQAFDYEGLTYYVNAFPISENTLVTMPSNVCAALGAEVGCLGFSTVEGRSNELPFGLSISTNPMVIEVPEPAALAVVGTALLGAGLARRRSRLAQGE